MRENGWMAMDLFEAISGRRSVRDYTTERPTMPSSPGCLLLPSAHQVLATASRGASR